MAITLDLFEYANDVAAQAAYVSSDSSAEEIVEQSETHNHSVSFGRIGGGDYQWLGQSFTLPAEKTITAIALYQVSIIGSPTGVWTIRIETDDAGEPSGTLVNENATVTLAPPGNGNWGKATFATPFIVSGSTRYWIVIKTANQAEDNYNWRIGGATDDIPDESDGTYNTGSETWTIGASNDVNFRLYAQKTPNLQCYSEGTIKQQGDYSLKTVAQQTESLNDTLTRTVGPTIDLSGIDTLELYVYASRTGTHISISIHDSGGTTTTKTIAIASAEAWTKIVWDISAVADANKDAIDNIIIKVTNAAAENTFYVDNFYGAEIEAYPVSRLNKNRITGYHCFMDAYMRAKRGELNPLKLPDGTVF